MTSRVQTGAAPAVEPQAERLSVRIAANASALIAARVGAAASLVVTTPLLLHMLGPRQFGLWSVLVATVAVVGLADLGFGLAQTREVARSAATGDCRRARIALALGLVVYGTLTMLLLTFVVVAWRPFAAAFNVGDAADGRGAALLLVAAFAIDVVAMPWRATLEGNQRLQTLAGAIAAGAVCEATLGVVLVAGGLALIGLGIGAIGASVVRALIVVHVGRKSLADVRPSLRGASLADVRELLGYGVSVQVTHAASAVNTQSDRMILAALYSPTVVTPFVVGTRLVAALNVAASYVASSLFPAISALHARGERELVERLYVRATRYLALFGSVTSAALVVTAGPLVELWIGHAVPLAATTVVLLAPGYALGTAAGAAAVVTRAEGRPGRETRAAAVAAALNLALTMPLVLLLGTRGVPCATGIALATAAAYFLWTFHRSSRRPLRPILATVWKPIAACAIAAVLVAAVDAVLPHRPGRIGAAVEVAGRGTALVVFVTVALVALGFFDDAERRFAGRALRRLRVRAQLPAIVVGGETR